jgi:hypothetical protein
MPIANPRPCRWAQASARAICSLALVSLSTAALAGEDAVINIRPEIHAKQQDQAATARDPWSSDDPLSSLRPSLEVGTQTLGDRKLQFTAEASKLDSFQFSARAVADRFSFQGFSPVLSDLWLGEQSYWEASRSSEIDARAEFWGDRVSLQSGERSTEYAVSPLSARRLLGRQLYRDHLPLRSALTEESFSGRATANDLRIKLFSNDRFSIASFLKTRAADTTYFTPYTAPSRSYGKPGEIRTEAGLLATAGPFQIGFSTLETTERSLVKTVDGSGIRAKFSIDLAALETGLPSGKLGFLQGIVPASLSLETGRGQEHRRGVLDPTPSLTQDWSVSADWYWKGASASVSYWSAFSDSRARGAELYDWSGDGLDVAVQIAGRHWAAKAQLSHETSTDHGPIEDMDELRISRGSLSLTNSNIKAFDLTLRGEFYREELGHFGFQPGSVSNDYSISAVFDLTKRLLPEQDRARVAIVSSMDRPINTVGFANSKTEYRLGMRFNLQAMGQEQAGSQPRSRQSTDMAARGPGPEMNSDRTVSSRSPIGGFGLQFGAYLDPERGAAAKQSVQSVLDVALPNYHLEVVQNEGDGLSRLRTAAIFSSETAHWACKVLVRQGQDCFVVAPK